jgi:GNAT superfamily N-acetyltransferase
LSTPQDKSGEVVIRRWREVADRPGLEAALDAIFFEASSVQSFPSAEARAAFRERWLGRYLQHDPDWAYLAIGPGQAIAGYLVGAIEDPALTPRFGDIAYFAELAAVTARYPAHLHINMAASARGLGIGARLVAAFLSDLRAAGVPGVHVVTGQGMRNVRFYERLGFSPAATRTYNGKTVVMLAREP